MSRLYPDPNPPKVKVQCIHCAEFDMQDMWCPSGKGDIQDPYEFRRCQRFVRIKEPSK